MSGAGLDSLYQEVIMDHSKQRHGAGLRDDAATSSHQLNPTCGDELTLNLHLDATGDTIDSVSWDGQGCVISQASMSMLHDLVCGLPLTQMEPRLAAFREMMRSKGQVEGDPDLLGDAVALAGVSRYVARVKCAMLGWVALEDAMGQLQPDIDQTRSQVPH